MYLKEKVHNKNYKRLLTWMSVGDDCENGLWAIYGARLGCYMTNIDRSSWDWRNVRDFDWLTKYFEEHVLPGFADNSDELCPRTGQRWNYKTLQDESNKLGYALRSKLDLEIADLGIEGSRFFKEVYINPSRMGAQIREEQVEDTLE
jgi:hypothetical protein